MEETDGVDLAAGLNEPFHNFVFNFRFDLGNFLNDSKHDVVSSFVGGFCDMLDQFVPISYKKKSLGMSCFELGPEPPLDDHSAPIMPCEFAQPSIPL